MELSSPSEIMYGDLPCTTSNSNSQRPEGSEGAMMLSALIVALGLQVSGAGTKATITLTWSDFVNPVGTTYKVYKTHRRCSAVDPVFTQIETGVTGLSVEWHPKDTGAFCFYVTAVDEQGRESDPSNLAEATI